MGGVRFGRHCGAKVGLRGEAGAGVGLAVCLDDRGGGLRVCVAALVVVTEGAGAAREALQGGALGGEEALEAVAAACPAVARALAELQAPLLSCFE